MKTVILILLIVISINYGHAQDQFIASLTEEPNCNSGKWEESSPSIAIKIGDPCASEPAAALVIAVDTPKLDFKDSSKLKLKTGPDTNYIPPERFKTRLPQAL